jgi:hypothetical protein
MSDGGHAGFGWPRVCSLANFARPYLAIIPWEARVPARLDFWEVAGRVGLNMRKKA